MSRRSSITGALAAAALLAASPGAARAEPGAVGRYTSSGTGPVNTWWVETAGGGLIVVDAQRDLPNARAAVAAIGRAGLPVRAILITHPHPDHVTGLGTFRRAFPGAPVYAQAAVRDELAADTQGLIASNARGLGPDGTAEIPPPDVVPGDLERVTIDGTVVEARRLGAGESVAATAYWLPGPRLLASGDVVTSGHVPFVAEGRAGDWLAQIAALRAAYPADATVLPGHGDPAPLAALADAQAAYLGALRDLVAAAVAPGSEAGAGLAPGEAAGIVAELDRRFPTAGGVSGVPLERLHAWNLEAVRRELAGGPPGFVGRE